MSTPIIKHFGRISETGKILFYHTDLWDEQRTSLAGKEFELTIKAKYKKPSVSQFNYYFGCILQACLKSESFSHYSKVEDIHSEVMSPMFLGYSTKVVVGGKSWIKQCTKSLTELTKEETSRFIENVINFCGQEGIIVPEAESYTNRYYREINLDKE
jgi:hypothetical protein